MDRKCNNHPGRFCYIYGNMVLPDRSAKTPNFVKKAYYAYLGARLGDQEKSFSPHIAVQDV